MDIATLGLAIDSSQAVKAKGDLAAIVPAAAAAEKATASMGAAAQTASAKIASTASATAKFASAASGAPNAVKLTTQQMQLLSFQMNDLATQLASGSSPFMAIAQQGGQIVQVFGAGTGVGAAIRATGSALVSFVTNPLSLAVVGIAAASAGVTALWSAVGNSTSAEDALKRHKELIDRIRDAYGEAGRAATEYGKTAGVLLKYDTARQYANETTRLADGLRSLAHGADLSGVISNLNALQNFWARSATDVPQLRSAILQFIADVDHGTGSASALEKALAEVGSTAQTSQVHTYISAVRAMLAPLVDLENQAKQTGGALSLMVGTTVARNAGQWDVAFGESATAKDTLRASLAALHPKVNATSQVTEARNAASEIAMSFRTIEAAQQSWDRSLRSAESATQGFFSDLRSGLSSGKSVIDSLTNAFGNLENKLLDMAMNQAIAALFSSLFGSASPMGVRGMGSAVMSAGLYHGGRGAGETATMRYVHPAYFDNAPRFHSGVGPGEQAAIIRDDEAVLTPGQMRMLAPAGHGGSVVNVKVENAPQGTQVQQSRNSDGSVNLRIIIADAVSAEIHSGESKINRALEGAYGIRRQL